MSDFKTDLGSGPDPYQDWLSIQKVEQIRKDKEEVLEKQAETRSPDLLLLAGLLLHAKKIFNALSSQKIQGQLSILDSPADLIRYLSPLRKVLFELFMTDLSHDPAFIEKFSDAWHDLIRALSALEWLPFPFMDLLKSLHDIESPSPKGEGFLLQRYH